MPVPYVDFLTGVHKATTRDYLGRVVGHDQAAAAEVAIRFDRDYWDGERHVGYGGYRYDGRWRPVAQAMAEHYGLQPGASILDVGCGKGFLLYDFTQVLPGARVFGLDISRYAIAHARPEVRPALVAGTASRLPYPDGAFDFVVSLNTLHNLYIDDLFAALREIERVRRGAAHVCIEAYRNEREKVNLLYWQLTCRAFHTPREWEWIFAQAGYTGDYSYITFE
jgi:protein-L-isoaspartate(D-aspartate) O-methyltransferase